MLGQASAKPLPSLPFNQLRSSSTTAPLTAFILHLPTSNYLLPSTSATQASFNSALLLSLVLPS